MKISDTPFFKTTPLFYQPLSFYRKNLNPFFANILETQTPFISNGRGISTMSVLDLMVCFLRGHANVMGWLHNDFIFEIHRIFWVLISVVKMVHFNQKDWAMVTSSL